MSVLRVLLATTWEEPCGIAEHSALLKEAVEAADPAIVITPVREALNPYAENGRLLIGEPGYFDILHLNYHRALHSRWQPINVERARTSGAYKAVVITFHDTFGELPADDLSRELCMQASAFIVHEPCEGLPRAIYWRMGVPAWTPPYQFSVGRDLEADSFSFKAWREQPVLGSIGFAFPWKNYEQLCEVSAAAGWATVLIAPRATDEQITSWREKQPDLYVHRGFAGRQHAGALLSACDATAFCYTCANSGQSGAVLQGVAARKPVFALETCRQNRALVEAELAGGASLIHWGKTFEDLRYFLQTCPIAPIDARSVALAHRDSWEGLGRRYAELYRRLAR